MKQLFYIFFFSFGWVSFGQNQIPNNGFISSIDVRPISFQLNSNQTNSLLKPADLTFYTTNTLVIYNRNSNLYENYYSLGKNFEMSNVKSNPMYGFGCQRADSFNPNGTQNMGSAVIAGLLNLFFEKLQ